MLRQWIAVLDADEEVREGPFIRHVVPGRIGEAGEPLIHGHILDAACDCRPRIEETLDTLIVIHRHDV